jgi:hypothetical protein
MSEGLAFYNECFKPAHQIIGGDENALAECLMKFHTELRGIQKTCKTIGDGWNFRLPAARIIQYYLDWIGDSTWITSKNLGLLHAKHTLFCNWLEQYAHQNMDHNPLTGVWFSRKAM